MRKWISYLLALPLVLAAACPAAAAPSCKQVPGARQFVGINKFRFLIVGEMHGTNETPALVADLACNFASSRPVTVGIEFNVAATPVLNSYLQSDGGEKARQALLSLGAWHNSYTDGRSSKAMFALIEQLREFRSTGAKIRIAAFQPNDIGKLDQHYYELAMANNWAKIADEAADDLILILVGNLHAMKQLPARFPFASAASHLKSSETVSLGPEQEGGSAWNCQADGCQAHSLGRGAPKSRQVGLFATQTGGFDGSYSVGQQYSASQPIYPK